MALTFRGLTKITVSKPSPEKRILVTLQSRVPNRISVAFDLTSEEAMSLLFALQKAQVRHRIPTPPSLQRKARPRAADDGPTAE
jgi:hypothetical protein